jgi:L-ascorbate metabolism protein UlaG (beta-lactamase superfamily)
VTRPLATALALAVTAPPPGFVQPRAPDGRFVNLDGSGPKGLGAVLRWAVVDRITGRRRRPPEKGPTPTVKADAARLARPPARGEGIRLTWIGHATWLVQLDGVSLLVDPVLSAKVGPFIRRAVAPGLSYDDLPRIDAALVSHSHYDHLDLPTLARLRVPVVAGLGVAEVVAGERLPCAELGWWQSTRIGDVTITFVPAQHWSRRGLTDTNRTLWGGFVVEGPSGRVYHAGDSGWFDGFAEIGRRFPRLDAALLPIGAYEPGWFMLPQHVNPEQAVAAFEALGAVRMYAMHWGTFRLADEPLDEPPVRLEAERARRGIASERVRAPAVGETVELSARGPR